MGPIRRYPDAVRVVCDEDGLIERVGIGGIEPVPEPEVEYVRADLHRGAVDLLRESREYIAAYSPQDDAILDRLDAAIGGQ
jgi:hypothetical protein